ncbi:glycosyltransferase family 2 protein [Roseiconus lacunae]|uniref:glycosyltransferase family 2 protein n=1 Tax=Roseiconus lacunae TaxID=2605694 RepID=UPI003088E6F8|nr:glycosyltransferase family 2 protein [Stieleria sp. HD01]
MLANCEIKTPRVSVVMSCFNDETTIKKSLRSIQRQTLLDWELIVINDGSTDQSGTILDEAASQDARIRVVHQANVGLTRALIRGCDLAQAPFIARQDADDESAPARLEQQLDRIQSDAKIGFVSCFTDYVGPEGEFMCRVRRPQDDCVATHQLLNDRVGPPAHGTVMFRRQTYVNVGGYRAPFYFAQDADLWLRMAEVSHVSYLEDVLYRFTFRPESITGTRRDIQARFGILGQQCRLARQNGQDEQPILEQAERLTLQVRRDFTLDASASSWRKNVQSVNTDYLIGSQLVRNRDGRAVCYLKRVLRRHPSHLRSWYRLLQSYTNRCLGRQTIVQSQR